GLVRRRRGFGDRCPVGVLHGRQRADGDRSRDPAAADRVERLAFERNGRLLRLPPDPDPIIVLTVVGVLYFLWPRLKPRLLSTWHKAKEGAAIFRDRRRYLREVALPQGASYGCRIGVNVVFMAAFGIPVTTYTIFLVASSHM